MIDVIQIFKAVDHIEKPDYNTVSRQRIGLWENTLSKTGFFKNGLLTLPINSKDELSNKKTDLIIIQDIEHFDPFLINKSLNNAEPAWFKRIGKEQLIAANPQLMGFNNGNNSCFFEIFKIRKTAKNSFEIWLNPTDIIKEPARESHKIAEIKLGKPLHFKVNSKADFSMTGRKQRTFIELDYIIEYLGTADQIEYQESNKIAVHKTLPFTICKVVDERKILK